MHFVLFALLLSSVKIAGVEFVPKDLVFADAEPKSRVTAEGPLSNQCKWTFIADTRIGRHAEGQECVRFYFRSAATLSQECPSPNEQHLDKSCERITATDVRCPDSNGKITAPSTDARALSSGNTSDGKHQDVVLLPDGTRIVLISDDEMATAALAFPDGSTDVLHVGK